MPSSGTINYWPGVDVQINANKLIGINNLSLGFQLDWERWKGFVDNRGKQQMAKDAGFKLIRSFDFRETASYGYPNLKPCTYWNESSETGIWNWTNVDALVQHIFEAGAEPLFCLGWARDSIQNYIPPGMAVDANTALPHPQSYAAYAREWVKHFRDTGQPVRFYQIMNEPHFYFGWNPSDTTKLAHYVELWNMTAKFMRQENPNIFLSQDSMTMKNVLDYWILHGENVDFLDFHKYDADTVGQYSDAEMFDRAEQRNFETSSSYYGVNDARQRWFSTRGKWLPIIDSESNFSSGWQNGTDPKIQQMPGAVWLALVLRKGILLGLSYNVYFEFSSSRSWQEAQGNGWGFGMTNHDDNQPWYPYYVQKMIGSNLIVGDGLVDSVSPSSDVRCVAWVHNGKVNILLICKSSETVAVSLHGISGQLDRFWIDGTIPYTAPRVQNNTLDATDPFVMKGYTVSLLQGSL